MRRMINPAIDATGDGVDARFFVRAKYASVSLQATARR